MAGEDPEMVELKAGYRVGLKFDENNQVCKIILNNKEKYPDIRVIEVEEADLERELMIKGYEDGDEETLKTFSVSRKAYIVENDTETLIAPYDRQFASKTLWQRTVTIFAGPAANFVLAFLIFVLIGLIQGIPTNEPKLGELTADGAAIAAGLKEGDIVNSISGAEVSSWEDVVEIVQKNPNKEVEFFIERDGAEMIIPVTPKEHKVNGETIGLIGVYTPMEKSVGQSVINGAKEVYIMTIEIFKILGKLITGQFSIDALSGPVGIYAATDTVAKDGGILYLMKWTGLLSINLGIMNLLPIPALDGGRLLFFAVEGLRGKPLDRHKEGMVHFIGFALLMLLMLVVTWNDIQRFFLK